MFGEERGKYLIRRMPEEEEKRPSGDLTRGRTMGWLQGETGKESGVVIEVV